MKKKCNALDILFLAIIVVAVVAVGVRFTSSKTAKAVRKSKKRCRRALSG